MLDIGLKAKIFDLGFGLEAHGLGIASQGLGLELET